MELGLVLNTHGVGSRDDADWWHQPMDPDEMKPVEAAQLAERLGFHSAWVGDHVALKETSPESTSPVHVEGRSNPEVRQRGTGDEDVGGSKRHYPARPNILDGVACFGAIAASTSRIKFGPGVLIAPYRHPLSDARQYATLDYLSGGRVFLGVGPGWMKEEFEAVNQPHEHRLAMTEECIQIYKKAWTEPLVTYHGKFYDFENMGMDPKPISKPHPPIAYGAVTPAGTRLCAREADAFYPILVRPHDDPHMHDHLVEILKRELDRIGRPESEMGMMGLVSARISKADDAEARRNPRRNCGGTAEQIVSDMQRFAEAGYSLLVVAPDVPSHTYAEYEEQVEWLGKEVLPKVKQIKAAGNWRTEF